MKAYLPSARKVVVVGTGAWGTVLALLLHQRAAACVLFARTEAEAADLQRRRENLRFLPGVRLPEELSITADAERAFAGTELAVLAVPAQRLRENVEWLRPLLHPSLTVVNASKGIELTTGLRMSEVIAQVAGERDGGSLTLSGPNLSAEIVQGLPAATVVAAPPERTQAASAVQMLLSSERLRVYSSDDQVGVELGGAMKNVIAIGCGICDGLGYGHNARAGLITRGLAEMTRLAVAAGGDARTLAGLAGLGDLMATIAGPGSRNYSLGLALGRGERLEAVLAASGHVAEGVATATAALQLSAKLGVELPITAQLDAVFSGRGTPVDAARALMARAPGSE